MTERHPDNAREQPGLEAERDGWRAVIEAASRMLWRTPREVMTAVTVILPLSREHSADPAVLLIVRALAGEYGIAASARHDGTAFVVRLQRAFAIGQADDDRQPGSH